jgi:hypothetical protein
MEGTGRRRFGSCREYSSTWFVGRVFSGGGLDEPWHLRLPRHAMLFSLPR